MKKPSDWFSDAADILRIGGWQTGNFGDPVDPHAPHCLMGALHLADFDTYRINVEDIRPLASWERYLREAYPAESDLPRHLVIREPLTVLNDTDEMTEKLAIKWLEDASALAREAGD